MAVTLITILYIICFQICSWPSIIRIIRRGSSDDLSVWREVLILIGVTCQFIVMQIAGSPWQVWISPILSGLNVLALMATIGYYRNNKSRQEAAAESV